MGKLSGSGVGAGVTVDDGVVLGRRIAVVRGIEVSRTGERVGTALVAVDVQLTIKNRMTNRNRKDFFMVDLLLVGITHLRRLQIISKIHLTSSLRAELSAQHRMICYKSRA